MTALSALVDQHRRARCRTERAAIAAVIDDVHLEAGRPPSSRRVRGMGLRARSACAYAAADDACAYAYAAADDACAYGNDAASADATSDTAHAYAYAYSDADYAAARDTTPTKWIDMTPGIYLLQWRGTYDRAVTAIAHCRVEGDWVLVDAGHRTLWTSGTRPLTSLAATGPGDDHTLGEPSPLPRWLPVGAVSAIGPVSADVWGPHLAGGR